MLLHQLYPPSGLSNPSRIDADIVLVHGLQGHYSRTWTAEDNTVWPRDLLPNILQRPEDGGSINVRVLSLDYGGSIGETTTKTGIYITARSLLQLLVDKRDDPRAAWRPIIFVGHSLGSIIIKRAIQVAYLNTMFKSIRHNILGVVYFATFHHGTAGEFSSYLNKLLKCHAPRLKSFPMVTISPTKDMVKQIEENSGSLKVTSQDFGNLLDRLDFQNFVEDRPTELVESVVVQKHQGTIGIVTGNTALLLGDHLGLCKFGGTGDEEKRFVVVWKGMKRMIQASPRRKKLVEKRKKALDLLCPDVLCQSMMDKTPCVGTGQWFLRLPEVEQWLAGTSDQRLWVSGRSGCGKSYLAKQIVDRIYDRDMQEGREASVICAFLREPNPTHVDLNDVLSGILEQALDVEPELYIDRPFTADSKFRNMLNKARKREPSRHVRKALPAENNLEGLLAATVRQVLDIKPRLIREILTRGWPDAKPPLGWTPDYRELWLEVMRRTLTTRPLSLVVDGFDQMERQDREAFFEMLEQLKKRPEGKKRGLYKLKLLFFTNEMYPSLDRESAKYQFVRYVIGPENGRAELERNMASRSKILYRLRPHYARVCGNLAQQVLKAASGNYLYAEVMMGSLKHAHYSEDGLRDLLNNPPSDTLGLYDHVLGKVWENEENRRFVKRVLLWVAFQQEPLSLVELREALALQKAKDITGRDNLTVEDVEDCLDDHAEHMMQRFCGHLVKFENGRVELVHPSLRKYLTTKAKNLRGKGSDNVELCNHAEFYMEEAESHQTLGTLCATYLTMPHFSEPVRSGEIQDWNTWQAEVKVRMRRYPLLRYAALHWSVHLKLARGLKVPGSMIRDSRAQRERQQRLENGQEGFAQNWAEVGCYFHDEHETTYPGLCRVDEQVSQIPPPTGTGTLPSTSHGPASSHGWEQKRISKYGRHSFVRATRKVVAKLKHDDTS